MVVVTRFAPSPTGPLHLGHAFSAIIAHDMARAAGGTFLLRIEDIDGSRCRAEYEHQIYDDLAWLGLTWETPVMRQSDRRAAYDAALTQLAEAGLIYECTCRRADIAAALSAPQEGAVIGPDGPIYPGTCRHKGITGTDGALRLDMAQATAGRGPWRLIETAHDGATAFDRDELIATVGDVVLARRGMGTSYHLSVVIDDAAQGVTHVTRGADLFDATRIHVLLQDLLGLPQPIYHHHRLIRDDAGKRLAKRDDARALAKYRAEGATPADIRRMVGLEP